MPTTIFLNKKPGVRVPEEARGVGGVCTLWLGGQELILPQAVKYKSTSYPQGGT
jgi:hypothetical protein